MSRLNMVRKIKDSKKDAYKYKTHSNQKEKKDGMKDLSIIN